MATQKERAVIDLVINGEQSKTSLKEVTKATIDARKELNKLREADNPQLYKQKLADYKALNTAQREMAQRINETAKAYKSWQSSALDMAKGVLGGNLAMAGINTLIGLIPAATQKSMALKDQLADIAKTADLTDQEVAGLNESLKRIDTRTPTKELRAMAEIGGQFGVAKDKLDEFVEGTNMANVAIGKAFGNVEAMTTEVMGLRNVFQGIKTDDPGADILHISNALNVLETQGAATAPVMTDFASRMGGVLIPLGFTEGQVLGLSATLQELNVTAERGSTAVINTVQKMLTETATFAKIAGMPLEEYKQLIQKDINGALLKYVDGLKKVQPNQLDFAKAIEVSKLAGSGAQEVLSKLSVNQDLLNTRTQQGTSSLRDLSSITAEYGKKNYELAVNLKKLGEWWDNMLTGGVFSRIGEWFTRTLAGALGLRDATSELTRAAQQQQQAVKNLESGMNPLLKRYDELTGKSSLSKTEQAEVKKILDQIVSVIPTAVTQFDKYGNAIAISTGKARDFIETQKAIARYKERDAIEENQKRLTELNKQYTALNRQIIAGQAFDAPMPGVASSLRKMTNEEMKAALDRKKRLEQAITDTKRIIAGLSGEMPEIKPGKPDGSGKKNDGSGDKPDGSGKKNGGSGTTIDGLESKADKAENRKQQRAREQQQRLEDMMNTARQRIAKDQDQSHEKDLLALDAHYKDMEKLAAGNKAKLAEIAALKDAELAAIEAKEADRNQKEAEKAQKQELEDAMAHLENLSELEQAQAEIDLKTKEDVAIEKSLIEEKHLEALYYLYLIHYSKMEDLAKGDKEKLLAIAKEKKLALEALEVRTKQNQASQAEAATNKSQSEQEKQTKNAEKEEDKRKEKRKQTAQAIEDSYLGTVDILKMSLKKHTQMYKAALVAEQAWALADIAINQGPAMMKSIRAAAGLPFPGNLLAMAKSVLPVALAGASAFARVRAVAIGDAPGFIDGGYTDDMSGQPGGYYSKPTYFSKRNYRVAEDGRPEYVVSNPMLRNPVVANTVRALEALRRGGSTAPLTGSAQTPAPSASYVSDPVLLAEVRNLNRNIQDLAGRPVKAQFNYHAWKDETDRVLDIRNDTSL